MDIVRRDAVLSYWFAGMSDDAPDEVWQGRNALWWGKDVALDAEVKVGCSTTISLRHRRQLEIDI